MRTVAEMMDMRGKVALVTGGRGWLGSAICSTLQELGATVLSVGRGESKSFTESVRQLDIDLNDLDDVEEDIDRLVDAVRAETGTTPNVLVNNMCSWARDVDFERTYVRDVARDVDANLTPHLAATQRVAARMRRGDSIINVASMYGKVSPDLKMYRGLGGNALAYGVAKAGLVQATKYLAGLYGPKGIRVNSVSPGPFPRPRALIDRQDDGALERELCSRTMLCRVADREELKGVVALLATDLGSYITGADIAVDGGWTAW